MRADPVKILLPVGEDPVSDDPPSETPASRAYPSRGAGKLRFG